MSNITPDEAMGMQKWKGMSGGTAHMLIDRHSNSWSDVDLQMMAWLRANTDVEAILDTIPEGCTPTDAKVLREANHAVADEVATVTQERDEARAECSRLEAALQNQRVAEIEIQSKCEDAQAECERLRAEVAKQTKMAEDMTDCVGMLYADAERYRWLTEDHADPAMREQCRGIIDRMSVRSYSATSAAIDAARGGK